MQSNELTSYILYCNTIKRMPPTIPKLTSSPQM